MCNIIVYLAVDKDGTETMHELLPFRSGEFWNSSVYGTLELPRGTIKKLTGKDITWESGYVEYTGDNYDPTIH